MPLPVRSLRALVLGCGMGRRGGLGREGNGRAGSRSKRSPHGCAHGFDCRERSSSSIDATGLVALTVREHSETGAIDEAARAGRLRAWIGIADQRGTIQVPPA